MKNLKEIGELKNKLAEYFEGQMTHKELKECEKKIEELELLIPNSVTIFELRGFLEYTKGNFDEALSYFKKVLEIRPHSENAYHNMAHIYLMKKDYTNALIHAFEADKKLIKSKVYTNEHLLQSVEKIVDAIKGDSRANRGYFSKC